MNILVTGGTGFIGSPVVKKLIEAGNRVTVVSRKKTNENGIRFLSLDLNDFEETRRILRRYQFECAIHLAWDTTHGKFWTSPQNLDHLSSSLHLARVLAENGCKRFVGAGSCAEYDAQAEPLLESQASSEPRTLYGRAKHGLRMVLEKFFEQEKIEFSWLRFFYLFGPFEKPERLVPSVILRLLNGEQAICQNGKLIRDFLHIEDAAEAVCRIAGSHVQGPVNIASGVEISIREVAEIIAGLLGRQDKIVHESHLSGSYEPSILAADVGKLKNTGWRPSMSLERGLENTIHWWEKRLPLRA